MQGALGKCGNRCDLCPLYVENFTAGDAGRINALLHRYHQGGMGTPPQYTRGCDGCPSEGYIARVDCPIRQCADRGRLETCAPCEDMFCELLEEDMQIIEGAVARWGDKIPQEDFDRYLKPFLVRATLSRLRLERRLP